MSAPVIPPEQEADAQHPVALPRMAHRHEGRPLWIEVAPGELVDKITILQIKSERIADPDKLRNIRVELTALRTVQEESLRPCPELAELTAQLKAVNERLWQIEEDIRLCERGHDFGPRFVALARSVYHENDRRSALKRAINELLRSRLIEEKSYPGYDSAQPDGNPP
jgi:hypothetical protein